MKSKNFFKSNGSALVLGSSLASLVGQQNASANLLGSVKNFFFGDKTENEEKKLSLKERKEKLNLNQRNLNSFHPVEPLQTGAVSAIYFTVLAGLGLKLFSLLPAVGTIFETALEHCPTISVPLGFLVGAVCSVGKFLGTKREINKDINELKGIIKESMLEKQWDLEKFQKMLEDKDQCKKFLKQLLVLEPSSSENNKEDAPLLDKNKLNKKVEAFKDLFTKEPEELKSVKETDKKRIYKELINSLFYWCSGRMERLYDPGKKTEYEKNYFIAQDDIELASRIILLRKIVLGEKVDYQLKITNLTVKDFNKNIKDENMENFRKLLVFDIRNYISEQDANDETIINILTELTEPNEVGQPIDYYKKIKTFFEDEFKDKQKQNRVLLGLKNFFKEERLYNRVFKYVFKEAYESFKKEER